MKRNACAALFGRHGSTALQPGHHEQIHRKSPDKHRLVHAETCNPYLICTMVLLKRRFIPCPIPGELPGPTESNFKIKRRHPRGDRLYECQRA